MKHPSQHITKLVNHTFFGVFITNLRLLESTFQKSKIDNFYSFVNHTSAT